jgi:hypothetical protein
MLPQKQKRKDSDSSLSLVGEFVSVTCEARPEGLFLLRHLWFHASSGRQGELKGEFQDQGDNVKKEYY